MIIAIHKHPRAFIYKVLKLLAKLGSTQYPL